MPVRGLCPVRYLSEVLGEAWRGFAAGQSCAVPHTGSALSVKLSVHQSRTLQFYFPPLLAVYWLVHLVHIFLNKPTWSEYSLSP